MSTRYRPHTQANSTTVIRSDKVSPAQTIVTQQPDLRTERRVDLSGLVRAYILNGFFDLTEEMGVDLEGDLAAIGVSRELINRRDTFVSVRMIGQSIAEAVEKTGRRDFALVLASRQRMSDFGSIAVMLQTAATLRASFSLLSRYVHVDAQAFDMTMENGPDGERLLMTIDGHGATPEQHRWCTELWLAQCYCFVEGMIGKRPPIERVYFAYSQGKDTALYSRYFRAPVDYDAEVFGFEFPPGTLESPLIHANAELNGILQQYLSGLDRDKSATLEHRVRAVVRALLDSNALSIERVAKSLGCSSRTLQRRLKSESGITYSDLVSEVRQDLAKQFLAGTDMRITDLSFALGYSCPTNFTREFKKVTGSTPRDWRRKNTAKQASSAIFSPASLQLTGAI